MHDDGWHVAVATVVTTVAKSFSMYIVYISLEKVKIFRVSMYYSRYTHNCFFSLVFRARISEYTKKQRERERKKEVNSSKNAGNQITFIMTARWKQ